MKYSVHLTSSTAKQLASSFTKLVVLWLGAIFLSIQIAFAVDVNSANLQELDTIKGIGAKKAQAIINERNANGPFKDSTDLATRVKGIGDKSVANLMQAGLTINGSNAQVVGSVKTSPSKIQTKTAADFSAGQNSVTTQNNSATQTVEKAIKTEKAPKESKAKTKILIPASQTESAMTNQSTQINAATKKTEKTDAQGKQGYPKPKVAAEMTVKPANKISSATPVNTAVPAATQKTVTTP